MICTPFVNLGVYGNQFNTILPEGLLLITFWLSDSKQSDSEKVSQLCVLGVSSAAGGEILKGNGGRIVTERRLLLGNEAIARGLVENGCTVATSYPGTPASEILAAVAFFQKENKISMHTQWAVNEKIAFEIAYAGCQTGLRTAVAMKQVGLNVASDPLMSAAYMGVKGGFIVVSADDPGPISSQTEQDSRLMAMMARIPVLDPDTPLQAKEMIAMAYEISETFNTPVMLRPTTRVCHSRQDISLHGIPRERREVKFEKDPSRWAATPRFRFHLHTEVEEKLAAMAQHKPTAPLRLNPETISSRAIVSSGVAAAHCKELIKELNLWQTIPFYQVLQPFPLHTEFISELIQTYEEILIIEETMGVIEMQLADRHRVRGKLSNDVPKVGELYPEDIQEIIGKFAGVESETAFHTVCIGKTTDAVCRMPAPGQLFCHQKSRSPGDIHQRYRLLYAGIEFGGGRYRAVYGGGHQPGIRLLSCL